MIRTNAGYLNMFRLHTVCQQLLTVGFPQINMPFCFFTGARKEAKWHIDLWEANRQQLLAYGVKPEHIEISGICTYHNNDDFFSARRQGIRSGRILSGILLGV